MYSFLIIKRVMNVFYLHFKRWSDPIQRGFSVACPPEDGDWMCSCSSLPLQWWNRTWWIHYLVDNRPIVVSISVYWWFQIIIPSSTSTIGMIVVPNAEAADPCSRKRLLFEEGYPICAMEILKSIRSSSQAAFASAVRLPLVAATRSARDLLDSYRL